MKLYDPMPRDALLARVADLIRRTAVDDAEALIRELEKRVDKEFFDVVWRPGWYEIVPGAHHYVANPGTPYLRALCGFELDGRAVLMTKFDDFSPCRGCVDTIRNRHGLGPLF